MLGQRHFDVQLMGGAALHFGNIAEMKTGEGKTLVATLPTYLNALTGKGVHVVTVNDYLAKYHAEWMGRVYHFLGLSVGDDPAADDVGRPPRGLQRRHHLRHQQRVRLRLPARQHGQPAGELRPARPPLRDRRRGRLDPDRRGPDAADHLRPERRGGRSGTTSSPSWSAELQIDVDYEVDEKKRTVSVLEDGITRVEDHLGIDNLYDAVNTPLISFLNNAIKAKELFRNDRDYVVIEGEVLIVDEHTGRMLHGRRYNEGLHQAIEAKEGVTIREEYQTLATITLQNYFRLYDKLGGMTGTAMTEASEFDKIYKLGVIPIPTNMPMVREDQADLVYRTEDAKYAAIVDDISERHADGQPMLVGTTSVEKSEHLSGLLKRARHPAHGAQRQAARERGAHRRPGRPQGRRHGRHQHGRSRHRHHARRLGRVPRRRGAAPQGPRPDRALRRVRSRLARRWSSGSRSRSRPSTTRSTTPAACTSSAPSGTSRAGSTTSCAVGPAVRATRASPASTCRSRTT